MSNSIPQPSVTLSPSPAWYAKNSAGILSEVRQSVQRKFCTDQGGKSVSCCKADKWAIRPIDGKSMNSMNPKNFTPGITLAFDKTIFNQPVERLKAPVDVWE
jgi:hypothetical protein